MKQISLRLPDELFRWLKQLAVHERRSLQQQVVVELEARQQHAPLEREQPTHPPREVHQEKTHAS